ncbi:MAG: hypothetical protein IPP77_03780 [Bacteroidetes bacterium]|nr:hypothetical protein [Bacteroidota bacterium]
MNEQEIEELEKWVEAQIVIAKNDKKEAVDSKDLSRESYQLGKLDTYWEVLKKLNQKIE